MVTNQVGGISPGLLNRRTGCVTQAYLDGSRVAVGELRHFVLPIEVAGRTQAGCGRMLGRMACRICAEIRDDARPGVSAGEFVVQDFGWTVRVATLAVCIASVGPEIQDRHIESEHGTFEGLSLANRHRSGKT